MVLVEVGQLGGEHVGVGAGQACAAEHQVDLVLEDISGDPSPEKLHRHAVAIAGIHAGASKLQEPPGKALDWTDVVFRSGIEPAEPRGGLALDQPVGSNDTLGPWPEAVIDDQEMVSRGVIGVAVPSGCGGLAACYRTHLAIEYPKTQRLDGIDLGLSRGEADTQIAGAQFREAGPGQRGGSDHLLDGHRGDPLRLLFQAGKGE